jgi:hypothetical protein
MIAHKNKINTNIVSDPLEELPNVGSELSLKNGQNNNSIEVDFDKKIAKKHRAKMQTTRKHHANNHINLPILVKNIGLQFTRFATGRKIYFANIIACLI